MLQIVYISTAREPLSVPELEAVLAISRRNNQTNAVTGLLVAGGRRFLQALEGENEAVIATFERIKRDSRHFAIVELGCRTVDARAFGDWSMAYQAGGTVRNEVDLKSVVEVLTAPISDKNLRAQFTGFAGLHARAA